VARGGDNRLVAARGIEAVKGRPVDYPERDGKPVGETDFHIAVILHSRQRVGERFQPLPPAADGGVQSKELGLILLPREDMLRLVDVSTGAMLPALEEAVELALAAQQHVQREEERARHEAERAHHEAERARHEAERARHEAAHAAREAARADRAERESARLRGELETRKRSR
jgi:hypothetical protein